MVCVLCEGWDTLWVCVYCLEGGTLYCTVYYSEWCIHVAIDSL